MQLVKVGAPFKLKTPCLCGGCGGALQWSSIMTHFGFMPCCYAFLGQQQQPWCCSLFFPHNNSPMKPHAVGCQPDSLIPLAGFLLCGDGGVSSSVGWKLDWRNLLQCNPSALLTFAISRGCFLLHPMRSVLPSQIGGGSTIFCIIIIIIFHLKALTCSCRGLILAKKSCSTPDLSRKVCGEERAAFPHPSRARGHARSPPAPLSNRATCGTARSFATSCGRGGEGRGVA